MSEHASSPDHEEHRIRLVFGLPNDAPLPPVSRETVATYHAYLLRKLSFPFQALYAERIPPVRQIVRYVKVIGPSENVDRRQYGLFCKVELGDRTLELPLAEIGMQEDDPNRQFVDDYLYWLWNSR